MEVKKGLTTLEFNEEEQDAMFSIVAGILHLGNINFSESNGRAVILKPDLVDTVAKVSNYKSIVIK